MDISIGSMNALTARLSLAFNKYIPTVPTQYGRFAMTVPSSAGENIYPRIAELPGLREFLGQRVVHRISAQERFTIVNRTFEETLSVRREDLEDDQFGFLTPAIQQLAADAGTLPDKLVFGLLEAGHRTKGMDGQYYFDADHEGYGRDGKPTGFSNLLRPAATERTTPAWYLFNNNNPMKPMVFQTRRPFTVTARTQLSDGVVFHRNEFEWGTDGRCNAGYGLHNFALRSTAPLTPENLGKAIAMMENQYRKDGQPYNARPNILFAPTSLEGEARALLEKDFVPMKTPDGTWVTGSNPWSGTLELVVSPYLNAFAVTD
ncbi:MULTISPECIES: Mu-like prophage major head subunit gpT family protein [unclassified Saccharibacter]|uniref:Mu-like prophage major head subunit gpT family protein n=1 Tax=unclassified Saccharibacter TaxID=2648722 RepID=UPI00132925CD|nr:MULTISPECIES: Mu-like prophage major head subunit gpT family protein [unclassified Saccharibacter]MXV35835.1 head protein [Saccharibacter sp. EH611]MXV57956.1 head protein [Saccharibacter sp. EH70]MXV66351.1 head protein [Saccharibacter sp. EH60]